VDSPVPHLAHLVPVNPFGASAHRPGRRGLDDGVLRSSAPRQPRGPDGRLTPRI